MKQVIRAACLLVLFAGGAAQALPPLHENRTVRFSFYQAGLAHIVRTECPTIDARMMRGVRYALALRSHALDLGYTMDDVDALLANKTEENKLRAEIEAELARRGARPGNPDGYCKVGREEIAKDSLAGRLLRDRG